MFIPRTDTRRFRLGSRAVDWPTRFQRLAGRAKHPELIRFYQQGVVPADTLLSETPLVAMDFETTGLDSRRHSIISIGLVPFDMQRIYCRQARHWLLTPRTPLVDDSVQFHGITHSAIDDQPDLLDVLPELLECLAGRVVVVHHRAIEQQFLDAAFQRRVQEGICFPAIDTMALEARLHREGRGSNPYGSFLRRLFRRQRLSIRLADSRHRYNLPHYSAHHALTDAIATAELLQAQYRTHFTEQTRVDALWCPS
ncbi:MAG: 3'-5' exonuclease [Marinobacterium sp.]|nr:3'-5' exonuclease [Marinobacterium sp.]